MFRIECSYGHRHGGHPSFPSSEYTSDCRIGDGYIQRALNYPSVFHHYKSCSIFFLLVVSCFRFSRLKIDVSLLIRIRNYGVQVLRRKLTYLGKIIHHLGCGFSCRCVPVNVNLAIGIY